MKMIKFDLIMHRLKHLCTQKFLIPNYESFIYSCLTYGNSGGDTVNKMSLRF